MANNPEDTSPHAAQYEIRVQGCMDALFWADWFGGLQVAIDQQQGETILHAAVAGQDELYALLARLRNKGLALISVQQIDPQE